LRGTVFKEGVPSMHAVGGDDRELKRIAMSLVTAVTGQRY
jgi:hypothetical protein